MKFRYESFGGIVGLEDPPALVWVDQALAREMGHSESRRWLDPSDHLSGPTEVHLMTTNRCPAGCPGCYTSSTARGHEASTDSVRAAITRLADLGVFHLAMGGGESLLRADLFELAGHARAQGMVPNLTTSGLGMTAELAGRCRVFGQVNVSLDGLGDVYRTSRGYDGADVALRALTLLSDAGVPSGVNTVVNRATLPTLDATVAAAAQHGANEVELLRFKPAGRAREIYQQMRLTTAQAAGLMDTILGLSSSHGSLDIKVDCSLVPFLCAAGPPVDVLEAFAVFGCEAGNVLTAVKSDLTAVPCSFIEDPIGSVDEMVAGWDTLPSLGRWRAYHQSAPEPCGSCPYRTICKGGCKAVTQFVTGETFGPDPECPRVVAHRSQGR